MPRTLQATKHFQLTQSLRQQLKAMPPGSPIPTLNELKLAHEASQSTIDRALATLRREGLVVRPAGKQRLVVSEISDTATRRIAVIRPDYPSRTFDEVSRAIVEEGRRTDVKFDLVYYRSLQTLDVAHASRDADGSVLIATSEPYPPHLRAALERPRKPLVLAQEIPPRLNAHGVHVDNRLMVRMAVDHLRSLGHQRILFFNNEPPTYACAERREAWREAMCEAGLEADDSYVCDCGTRYFESSLEAAYREFNRWMEAPTCDFTAILVSTSVVAGMAVMRVLHERGIKVPDQVSIITYCGEESLGAFTNPPLTTLEPDMRAYGQKVAELLEELFADPMSPRRQIGLVPTLVVRSSTTAPRRNNRTLVKRKG